MEKVEYMEVYAVNAISRLNGGMKMAAEELQEDEHEARRICA